MQRTIEFRVQGSAEEPYTVTFTKKNESLTAFCTCEAGVHEIHCKHRIRILEGKSVDVVSGDLNEIDTIQSWLEGTELEKALENVKKAEKHVADAKRLVSNSKRILANIMHNS